MGLTLTKDEASFYNAIENGYSLEDLAEAKRRVDYLKRMLAAHVGTDGEIVLENNLVVVDKFDFKEIKTKQMSNAMKNLKVEEKALIVLPASNEIVQKSARNLANVGTSSVNTINVYDLLKYKKLVLTVDTIKKLEEVYA